MVLFRVPWFVLELARRLEFGISTKRFGLEVQAPEYEILKCQYGFPADGIIIFFLFRIFSREKKNLLECAVSQSFSDQ
jgi:hypothetical protein